MIHALLPLLLAVRVAMPTITASPGSTVTSPSTITVTGVSRSTGSVTYCADGAAPRRVASQRGPLTVSSVGSHTIACRSYTLDGREASRTASLTVTVNASAPAALASCETAPLRNVANPALPVYYYCSCGTGAAADCVEGNDNNNGTSPGTPRKTLNGFTNSAGNVFNAMPAGGTVALCRGGAWDSTGFNFNNTACGHTEDTYCDLRDYGDAAKARPRINSGLSNTFTSLDGLYGLDGFRFWNLDIRHTRTVGAAQQPRAFWVLNEVHYVDICNVAFDGAYQAIDWNPQYEAGALGSYTTFRYNTFTNTRSHAVGAGSDHLVVDHNTFINNGTQAEWPNNPGWSHTVYLACNDSARPCSGVKFTNNYVRTDPDGAWGYCRGIMVIFRGWQPGLEVSNNYVQGDAPYACGGIMIAGSAAYTEVHDAVVTRNRVIWGNQNGSPFGISACQNCTISDNVISTGGTTGATIPERSNASNSNFAVTTAATVRDNSIYMRNGGTGLTVGAANEGTDFIVENNAVWTASGGSCINLVRPAASGHPFTPPTYYPATVDMQTNTAGNYCVNNGAAASAIWVDPLNGDFRPVVGGPLIGTANQTYYSPVAADPVWSATGTGVPRTPPNPPVDIGALVR